MIRSAELGEFVRGRKASGLGRDKSFIKAVLWSWLAPFGLCYTHRWVGLAATCGLDAPLFYLIYADMKDWLDRWVITAPASYRGLEPDELYLRLVGDLLGSDGAWLTPLTTTIAAICGLVHLLMPCYVFVSNRKRHPPSVPELEKALLEVRRKRE